MVPAAADTFSPRRQRCPRRVESSVGALAEKDSRNEILTRGNPSNAYPPIPTVPFLPPVTPPPFILVLSVVVTTAKSINHCWICVSLSTANEPSPRSSNEPSHEPGPGRVEQHARHLVAEFLGDEGAQAVSLFGGGFFFVGVGGGGGVGGSGGDGSSCAGGSARAAAAATARIHTSEEVVPDPSSSW